jgi:sugar phosphate permease
MDGAIATMFELAGPLSVLFAGIVTDKVFGSRRMPVAVMCLLSLSVVLFLMDNLPANRLALGAGFFTIGILLYAPDSLISGTAAVDFGTRKGAGTAAGFINGCGSFGAVLGGFLPGLVKEHWGWDGIFLALSISILIAGLLLLPHWNKLPQSHSRREAS